MRFTKIQQNYERIYIKYEFQHLKMTLIIGFLDKIINQSPSDYMTLNLYKILLKSKRGIEILLEE